MSKANTSTKTTSENSRHNFSKKWALITVGFLIIVSIAVYALTYWYFVHQNEVQVNNETSANSLNLESAQGAIDGVVTLELGGTALDITSYSGMNGRDSSEQIVYHVAPHSVEGRTYKNIPASSVGAGFIASDAESGVNYTQLTQYLTNNKFKQVSGYDTAFTIEDDPVEFIEYSVYTSDQVVCSVEHVDATNTSIGSYYASIACADIKDYVAVAKNFDAVYRSYESSDKEVGKIAFGSVSIDESGDKDVISVYQYDSKMTNPEEPGANIYLQVDYRQDSENSWTLL